MPFHIGDFFNNIKRNIVENKTIYSLTANPIYMSFLIIAIMSIIIVILFDADDFVYSIFKVAIYGVITTVVLLLFHDNAINLDYKARYGGYSNVFNDEPLDSINNLEVKPTAEGGIVDNIDHINRKIEMLHNNAGKNNIDIEYSTKDLFKDDPELFGENGRIDLL